jgi:uncharacterized UPF0146 family protein
MGLALERQLSYEVSEVESLQGLIEYLSSNYKNVVEIGIGGYAKIAMALQERGLSVVATDIQRRTVEIPVVLDDVRVPKLDLYRDAEALYSVRPPLEMVPSLKRLAERLAKDLIIKPLAAEPVDGLLINRAGSFFYLFPSTKKPSHQSSSLP